MREDEKFADYVRGLVRDLDPVPEPPREAIWARIEELRASQRPRRGFPGVTWVRWAAPLAASLVIGIGIGRFALPAPGDPTTAVAETEGPAVDPNAPGLPYRIAAVHHLDATEALLTALPVDVERGNVDEVSRWAEELLVTTRLMLDSPAAGDPELAALFQDLELLLTQIACLSDGVPAEEIELIEQGIRENDVLHRVRAATTRRSAAGI